MFSIVPAPTFTQEVQLSRPDSNKPVLVDITWRHKDARALQAWLLSASAAPDEATFLDEVVAGWGRFVDADGKPLPYSKEALAVLLQQFPSASVELLHAYRARLADARAKN